MCTAVNFSNRILYSIFARLVLCFHMTESKTLPAETHYVRYSKDTTASNAMPSDFRVVFKPRDKDELDRWMEQSNSKDC